MRKITVQFDNAGGHGGGRGDIGKTIKILEQEVCENDLSTLDQGATQ